MALGAHRLPVKVPEGTPRQTLMAFALSLACIGAGQGGVHAADGDAAATLRNRYGALQTEFPDNPFHQPLYLDSGETANGVAGSIHALIDASFVTARAALEDPGAWCDILLLHQNTKYCRASASGTDSILRVYIGRKHGQPLNDAYRVDFKHRLVARTKDYLKVLLSADHGPLSTRDYRIMLEAVPLDGKRTVLHLSYSYTYGLAGRMAMQGYLATIGSGKVGFTITGKGAEGRPVYIDGMRGLVERNTMRYYLAIAAHLGALSSPPQARQEQGLHDWFASVERYPLQLHELEQAEYLDMKRKEFRRSRDDPGTP
jgi:hypothetical protein